MKHLFLLLLFSLCPVYAYSSTGNANPQRPALQKFLLEKQQKVDADSLNLLPPFPSLTPLLDSVVAWNGELKAYFGYINNSTDTVFIYQDTAGSAAYTYNVINGPVDVPLDTALWNLQYFYPGEHHRSNSGSLYFATFPIGGEIVWTLGKYQVIANEAVLPVELTSFTAEVRLLDAVLYWSTATETNTYGFEIERSIIENQTTIANWSSVGFVPGAGTSNSPREYEFVDKVQKAGHYAYRLKQIDRDGKFEYYGEAEVEIAEATEFALKAGYPNPFNPSTTIAFSIPQGSKVSLKVFNILGQEVATLVDDYEQAGEYKVQFNASKLASGVYFCRMQASDFVQTKKLLLLK
jgi:hypothetical protein